MTNFKGAMSRMAHMCVIFYLVNHCFEPISSDYKAGA